MSANIKRVFSIALGTFLLSFGCATIPAESVNPSMPAPEPRSVVPGPEQAEDMKKPAPRTLAALRLTEQARLLIASNKADEAIRMLEKAVNIDPGNGQNYYYLAEAWMIKGNNLQAGEFNRMAEIYLDRDAAWLFEVQQQKDRIEKMKNAP